MRVSPAVSALLAVLVSLAAGSATARTVHMNPANAVGPPAPERNRHVPTSVWDTAFHLEYQKMFDQWVRPMEARWLRHYDFGVNIGLGLGGIPESIVDKYSDANGNRSRRGRNALWGGLVVERMFWGGDGLVPYIGAELGLGLGKVFQRKEPSGGEVEAKDADLTYVEPAVFGTFVNYAGLDFGARLAVRVVRMNVDAIGSGSDLSGVAIGMMARKRL